MKLYASGSGDAQPCDVGGVHMALHSLHKHQPTAQSQNADEDLEHHLRGQVFCHHAQAFKYSKLEMAVEGMLTLNYVMPKALRSDNIRPGWSKPGLYPLSFHRMMQLSRGFKTELSSEEFDTFKRAIPEGVRLVRTRGLVPDVEMDRMKLPKTLTQIIAETRPG